MALERYFTNDSTDSFISKAKFQLLKLPRDSSEYCTHIKIHTGIKVLQMEIVMLKTDNFDKDIILKTQILKLTLVPITNNFSISSCK